MQAPLVTPGIAGRRAGGALRLGTLWGQRLQRSSRDSLTSGSSSPSSRRHHRRRSRCGSSWSSSWGNRSSSKSAMLALARPPPAVAAARLMDRESSSRAAAGSELAAPERSGLMAPGATAALATWGRATCQQVEVRAMEGLAAAMTERAGARVRGVLAAAARQPASMLATGALAATARPLVGALAILMAAITFLAIDGLHALVFMAAFEFTHLRGVPAVMSVLPATALHAYLEFCMGIMTHNKCPSVNQWLELEVCRASSCSRSARSQW